MKRGFLTIDEMRADMDSLTKWVEETHTDLHAFVDEEKWLALKEQASDSLNKARTADELYQILKPLISHIRDIHTRIFLLRNKRIYYLSGGNYLPIRVRYLKGKVYVVSSKDSVIEKGSELLSINNYPVAPIVERMIAKEYEDGKSIFTRIRLMEIGFPYHVPYYIPIDSTNRIRYRSFSENRVIETSVLGEKLKRPSKKERKASRKAESQKPVFTMEESGDERIAHMKIRSFSRGKLKHYNRFLKKNFKQLEKAKVPHLVLDLRNNTGGYLSRGVSLVSYMMPDSFVYISQSIIKGSPMMKYKLKKMFFLPGLAFKVFGKSQSKEFRAGWQLPLGEYDTLRYEKYPVKKDKFRYSGQVWLLVNGLSASNSVLVHHALAHGQRARVVGEASGGTDFGTFGNSLEFILENSGISGRVSSMRIFTKEQGGNTEGKPLAPDVYIPDQIEDIVSGKDTQLEYVRRQVGALEK